MGSETNGPSTKFGKHTQTNNTHQRRTQQNFTEPGRPAAVEYNEQGA